jgi:hypothetical protein
MKVAGLFYPFRQNSAEPLILSLVPLEGERKGLIKFCCKNLTYKIKDVEAGEMGSGWPVKLIKLKSNLLLLNFTAIIL